MSIMRRESRSAWPTTEFAWPDERIDRAFRDMFRDVFAARSLAERYEKLSHPLHVEEFMQDGMCVVRAELPGIDPEKDLQVTVQDGALHIEAHRTERSEEERPDSYRSEFRYGEVRRSIPLPEGASEADITAIYKDGILDVRLPVTQPAGSSEPKAIPISRG